MARFTDFLFGSNIATWHEAIGEVLSQLEDQRQLAMAAIYLSSAALFELNSRYATLTGTQLEPGWQVETFREHLQEIIQASLMLSSSRAGVSQVVAATTMVPPVIKSIDQLRRWLLGFQFLPNRHFFGKDGTVIADVDESYILEDTDNVLLISVGGGALQRVTLPTGLVMAEAIIDAINAQLLGAKAIPFGLRFAMVVDSVDADGSIRVDGASSAAGVLGLDTFLHQNAPAPSGSSGSIPAGWRLEAPAGSVSQPFGLEASLFNVEAPAIEADKDSPYHGLVTATLIPNGGFESDFDGWDASEGPAFFISQTKFRSGNRSLAFNTGNVTPKLRSARVLVPPGRKITLKGFHQANSAPSLIVYEQAAGFTLFNWLVTNAIRNQSNSTVPLLDPLASNVQPPTVVLYDPSTNFIAAGVKAGMAVQVFSGGDIFTGRVFVGVIVGVQVNFLLIDVWRDSAGRGATLDGFLVSTSTTVINVGGLNSTEQTARVRLGPIAASAGQSIDVLGVHTAPFVNAGGVVSWTGSLADKIQVPPTSTSSRTYVRDINGGIVIDPVTGLISVILKDWGGPLPSQRPCSIWLSPLDGAQYRIWKSINAVLTPVVPVLG